jgi:Na+-translocating ferredoxin:NAD+ oxidoreductase RNF subunit RnfB
MDLILVAVISLGAIGLIAAVILYAASKKFAVYEDPRIAKVNEVLLRRIAVDVVIPVVPVLRELV